MDIKKALEITRNRIECLDKFVPTNKSEVKIGLETMEYLQFVEKLLVEIEKDYNHEIYAIK